jgi:methionyl-tRNA formyltransferase
MCGKDALRIWDVQLEGKKRMNVKDFLLGCAVELGEKLGN